VPPCGLTPFRQSAHETAAFRRQTPLFDASTPCRWPLTQVAWTCPEAVSPYLEHFIGPWCAALRHLQDGIEKEHAFLGLCDVVRLNPQVMNRNELNL